MDDKFTNENVLTEVLFTIGKLTFNEEIKSLITTSFKEKCSALLLRFPTLSQRNASRNFFNMLKLNHFDKPLFDHLSTQFIREGEHKKQPLVGEIATVTTLRAFAKFKYNNFDVLEILIKEIIQCIDMFQIRNLATISL